MTSTVPLEQDPAGAGVDLLDDAVDDGLVRVAGHGPGRPGSGTDYIYDRHYQPIATVHAGNGLSADGHEFLITPQNTALILAYATATADLTSIGGPVDVPTRTYSCSAGARAGTT